MPWLGAGLSAFLVGPWARNSEDYIQYKIALGLLAIGIVLWAITFVVNKLTGTVSQIEDVDALAELGASRSPGTAYVARSPPRTLGG